MTAKQTRPTSATTDSRQQVSPDKLARAGILLVDDHHPNLVALEAILEPLGEDLVTAHSGEEALLRLLEREFAVILMDVQMPQIDGLQTASLIKKRVRSRDIPIIFLTATSRESSNIFAGYEHGGVDYLLKPFDPSILRSKVRVFVELFRQREKIKIQEFELRKRERETLERRHEERFRGLSDAMPQALWAADPEGNVYHCNRVWLEYSGLTLRESRGDGLFAAVHAEDRDRIKQEWQATVRSHAPFETRFRLRDSHGTYRWHLGRAVPEKNEGGATVGWIGTATDIDQQYRAEQARAVVEEVSAGLITSLDPAQLLTGVAERVVPRIADFCSFYARDGINPIEQVVVHHTDPKKVAIVRELFQRFPPASDSTAGFAAVIRSGVAELVESAGPEMLQSTAVGREHRQLLEALAPVSWMIVPIIRQQKTFGAIIFGMSESGRSYSDSDLSFAREIANRVGIALEHARLFTTANEANRLKDEFVATISHELRTPLNAILGWTRMLRAGMLNGEKQARALETIERNANAQTQLVEDLLDISRIITGKLRLELRPIDPKGVIEAALDGVRPAADAKGVTLDAVLQPDSGPIEADPDRLQQVVWNLLTNAIKFTPAGGSVRLALRPTASAGVEISVEDSGQGITADFLPFVFERFRQADGASTRAHGGLGLGLALVRHIVELHGGGVGAASDGVGRGATFTVTLPVSRRPSPAPPAPKTDDGERPTIPTIEGVRVLVIDPEADGGDMLRTVLEHSAARVSMVRTADEGIAAISHDRPDIVVCAVDGPENGSYDVITRIRALSADAGGATPVIALTPHTRSDDRRHALAAGFNAALAKPIAPGDLVAVLTTLSGRRARA